MENDLCLGIYRIRDTMRGIVCEDMPVHLLFKSQILEKGV